MTVSLGELTWTEAEDAAARNALLAVPVGATEQHGPHLPLCTDTEIAVALANRLASLRSEVLVAPPIAYGSSGEHAGFAGTLSIGAQAIELLLLELGRSASETFSRMLVISAHGGNSGAVRNAERRLRAEGRDVRVFSPSFDGDAHAGHVETSIMLALQPSLVRGRQTAPGERAPLAQILPRLVRDGVRSVSANGVLGDPTSATAEHGHTLLEGATGEMLDLLDNWQTR